MKLQHELIKKNSPAQVHSIVVLDDCIDSSNFWEDDTLLGLFLESRQYCITVLLTLGDCKYINPIVRSNFDYVFMFRMKYKHCRKQLYNLYGNGKKKFPDFDHFNNAYEIATENSKCMVIKQFGNPSNFSDIVYWYELKNNTNNFNKSNKKSVLEALFSDMYIE